MAAHPLPPVDFAVTPYRVAVVASVWGTWRERAAIALPLIAFAAGLLLPVLIQRDRTGQLRVRHNHGGTLRARAGGAGLSAANFPPTEECAQ